MLIAKIIYNYRQWSNKYHAQQVILSFWKRAIKDRDEDAIEFTESALSNPQGYTVYRPVNMSVLILKRNRTSSSSFKIFDELEQETKSYMI